MGDVGLLLVKTIEKFPILYNPKLVDYHKKDITEKAWTEISEQVELSVGECKEKWKNLRYSLIRSLKPNRDGSCKKKYYLHKHMEFLLPYLRIKSLTASFDDDLEEDQQDSAEKESSPRPQFLEYDLLTEPMPKRLRNDQDPFMDETYHDKENRKMFLLGLMPEINALTEAQMKKFRRKVLALLDEITGSDDDCREIKLEPPADCEVESVM